jgi:TPR repeat protein
MNINYFCDLSLHEGFVQHRRKNVLSIRSIGGAISMGMAFTDAVTAYDRGDYAGAARVWQWLGEQGDARAQSNLGVMYAKGRGVRQDHAAAAHWYRKAAERGNSNAQFNLALMHTEDRGVPQDHGAAAAWYQKAAEQGHGRAQYNLGIIYTPFTS